MLRIHRKADGDVVFTLSGRIDKEHVAELEALIGAEGKDRRIILDFKDMTLTGQDGINFLAQCEAAAIGLRRFREPTHLRLPEMTHRVCG
jgi:anti-anti-sigma regulatory factor